MAVVPSLEFKQGDDFKLEMTVTDKSNATAVAAKIVLDAAIAANPQVPVDIAAAQVTYDAAIIVDITGWTITSQVRWKGTLITALSSAIISAVAGTFEITTTAAVTALWSPRDLTCDVQFDRPGIGVTSSQTFIIKVQKDQSFV